MTFFRVAFLCAFVMLIIGVFGAQRLLEPLFPSDAARTPLRVADRIPTPTAGAPTHLPSPTVTPWVVTATPTRTTAAPASPTVTPPPTIMLTPTAHPINPRTQPTRPRRRPTATAIPTSPVKRATATATSVPTTTPLPTPTAATGVVALARYWVDSLEARRGQLVAIGYLIENGTGRTQHVFLGASLKPRSALGWDAAINDSFHDVVAVVPPGISTHLRYFALPAGLRPGMYDVAWGLRDALTGRREALASAAAVLTVTR